ncbi:TetR/AcrR family transcriptional regulator [Variovorax boronicumulans]|uniref:TetR/AcrR family transcriptional regulator n=1 Tax=Variovorax boronicumulans TaxID=436515 RepID=UPI0036F1B720
MSKTTDKAKRPAASKHSPAPKRSASSSAKPASCTSRHQRLMDAAVIEFSERGFDGASVLSIAKRAGVKQPLLNYHFGGKDGLWRAVVEEAYAEATQALEVVRAKTHTKEPVAQLREALRAFAIINVLHPAAHSLVLREVAQAGPRLDWLVETYMRPFHNVVDGLLAECHKAGLDQALPPRVHQRDDDPHPDGRAVINAPDKDALQRRANAT